MKTYRKILIVDDSPTSRMIIQRCFEMIGAEAGEYLYAENGIEGLTIAGDEKEIDLVFSDINMPKMDGKTFIKLLRNKPETANIPVIITSSIADSVAEAELKELSISGYIKKPVLPEKIMHILGGVDERS